MRSVPSLPSLLALRAFEAVARHGSMTRACDELLITQSAISHHIRGLEGELGSRLFFRYARGLSLTDAGKRYHCAVALAFGTITSATVELRASTSTPTVRASVLSSFAPHWLVPRMSRFRAAYPETHIELDPTFLQATFDDGTDVALRYGSGAWPGLHTELLITELLTPVVASRHAGDVASMPLLLTIKSFDWDLWCAQAGREFIGRKRVQFTDYNIALQAALNGEGLAMGRLRLIQNRLDNSELVAPFSLQVESPAAAYWCVYPKNRQLSTFVFQWLAWIRDEIAADN